MSKPKVIAIVGPTSSGKTALGIYLAKKLNGEIISADSRQVYRGLTIGTGKVTKTEMAGVPHHLLDVASPRRQFTVSDFATLGGKAIAAIVRRNNLPMVVGGTGLYADALLGRMSFPEVPPNPALRTRLEKKSAAQLFALLKKLDLRRAKTVEKQNPRRLIRAIEIAKALGKNPLPARTQTYDVLWIGITVPQAVLEKKIAARLRARLRQGMIAEAKRLHTQGLSYTRMKELGLEYRALAEHLQGNLTKEEMTAMLEKDIRRYAKRQMRWFNRNMDIRWVKNKSEALARAKRFLSR